ncbi:MAG: CoA transferase [Dehalococcoidia bacterium]|nr:CoA transferase [Dehalococcoidia bacterium]
MPLPLEGIRVLSQGLVWAGPSATLLLADMGAEVIEVETIQHLNPTRTNYRFPPKALMEGPGGTVYVDRRAEGRFWDRCGVFNYGKRNCKAVTINLNHPKGHDLFIRLAAQSDAFLENNAAHVVEKLGIDYPDLAAVNPRIIMLRFPGYGLTGPYKYYKGYGANVEAIAGHTSLRGYRDLDPSMTPPIYHADPTAASHGVFAIISALRHRERTGRGQLIDMSQAESVINHLPHAFMDYSMNRRTQEHWGNRHPSMAPHAVLPCRGDDEWIAIAVAGDDAFARLSRAMGRSDLTEDDRFADVVSRHRNQDELESIIGAWTATQEKVALMETLQAAGVAAAAVFKSDEMHGNRHLAERGFFETVTHPEAGTHPYPGGLAKFSATPLHIRQPAPMLGQHNEAVFKGIVGVSDDEYEELLREQIIGDSYLEAAK